MLIDSKYNEFCAQMQSVISGRMISKNEYTEYIYFLENTHFEPAALVAVAAYCAEMKGNNINYPYILKFARDFNLQHIRTAAEVKLKLNNRGKPIEKKKKCSFTLSKAEMDAVTILRALNLDGQVEVINYAISLAEQ